MKNIAILALKISINITVLCDNIVILLEQNMGFECNYIGLQLIFVIV
jgi:hypothetical protein